MAKTVGDLLVERLIHWGVDTIFGLPGDGINGIFEALRIREEQIRFIQVRHEESAALAACGYAKYTRRIGVCLATSGPGGIHLLNGLYDAKCDGQPVLAITGHTFHDLIGTHTQQDVDLDKVFMDVAVYNQRLMGPAHVHPLVDEAIKTSLARRGVSHITIPKDMQSWTADAEPRSSANVNHHSGSNHVTSHPVPPKEQFEQAALLINQGNKVVILAGQGALGSRAELLQLAELAGAVIAKPLLGKGTVPDDSPYTTGGVGLLGTSPSYDAIQECDTFIIAGSSFPYLEFYPPQGHAKVVQIDVDSARIGLRHQVDVGLVGDCRSVLQGLIPLIEKKHKRGFLEKAQSNMKDWNHLLEVQATRTDMPMKPQAVTYHLNNLLADDAIIAADSGTVTIWTARYIRMRGEMKFSLSGTLATMASGLPYSIAAAVSHPGRQVICIIGDGGFTMLMGEVATLAKYNLPVKIIIIKNNVLGMIKWEQIAMEGNPQYGVQLQPIDFAAYARACGIAGYTIEDPGKAESTLLEALAHDGPALVQAVVDPDEPPMPGHVTTRQVLNFAQALAKGQKNPWSLIKTVLKDKIHEVV